jgi:TetR/AcrR family transcriptional regulator, transcriptional repressor for nem operon
MTDLQPRPNTTPPVRQRLLEAAKELFHRHGITGTTIAQIADQANVPLGNVYYHFRSKEALLAAVVVAHREDIRADLELADCEPNPLERLRALVRDSERNAELLTDHGCPYASLAQGLRDEKSRLADDAGALLTLYLEFAERQFKLLKHKNAAELAADFIARLYGAYTLANSLKQPQFLASQLSRIETWLEQTV